MSKYIREPEMSLARLRVVEAHTEALPDSGLGMSNFDHTIDEGLAEALRNGKRGEHAAWNFHGTLWYDQQSEEFCELVRRYRVPVTVVRARSLEELMSAVNSEYGWD
jgi:hypothetical protein